jgi:hypothetical protein
MTREVERYVHLIARFYAVDGSPLCQEARYIVDLVSCESYLIRTEERRLLIASQVKGLMKDEDKDGSVVVFPRCSSGDNFNLF